MSLRAMTWAWAQSIRPASSKITLLALCDFANDQDHVAWPCTKTLMDMTGLDDRTIAKALKDLVSHGFLTDTEERRGRTGRVKVYRVEIAPPKGAPAVKNPYETCEQITTKMGELEAETTPKMGVLNHPKNGVVNGGNTPKIVPKYPQNCTLIPPKMGVEPIKEPLGTRENTGKSAGVAPAEPSPIKLFIDGWFNAFDEVFGERYIVEGAKDAKSAKRLLESTGETPGTLIEVARLAWANRSNPKCFNCRLASSIASFASKYNAIRMELRDIRAIQPKTENTKANEFDAIISNKS